MLNVRLFPRFLATSVAKRPSKTPTYSEADLVTLRKEMEKQLKARKELRKLKFKPPTIPRSPVALYVSEKTQDPYLKDQLREKAGPVLGQLAKEFKHLTPAEKERYLILKEEDRKRFQGEFKDWYGSLVNDPKISEEMREAVHKVRERFVRLKYLQ